MQFTQELIIVGVIAISGVLLNIFLILKLHQLTRHYNRLTEGIDKKTLTNVLQGIQQTIASHEHFHDIVKADIQKIKNTSLHYLQHLNIKRFNPFGDTGGDQSFILALLDGKKDGVVITSLHSRENTRFYVKSIGGGVGIDHPLSKEEEQIIRRLGK